MVSQSGELLAGIVPLDRPRNDHLLDFVAVAVFTFSSLLKMSRRIDHPGRGDRVDNFHKV
ncbi:MAG: hypothetical protein U0792_09735 [Gemmataceae bacterium]